VTPSRRNLVLGAAGLGAGGLAATWFLAGRGAAPEAPSSTAAGDARPAGPVDLSSLAAPDPGLEERALGPANARITLIEYASMTCPHCATFHTEVVPQLKTKYVDPGQMRMVFRHFTLNVVDEGASMMARCAPPERYFPLLDVLFSQQRVWAGSNDPVSALLAIARQAGFTQEFFERCLRDDALLARLRAARERAQQRFGVNSTPTIFINGQVFRGAMRLDQVEAVIAPMLRA
jgi:protein-disulfide isomerase